MWIHCVYIFKTLSIFVTVPLKSLSASCDIWIIFGSISTDFFSPWVSMIFSYFFLCTVIFFKLDFLLWFSGCSVGLQLRLSAPSVCVLEARLENAFRQKSINKYLPLSLKVRFIQFLPASGYSPKHSDCPDFVIITDGWSNYLSLKEAGISKDIFYL